MHARSRNKRRWDNAGKGRGPVDTGKRSKSNLPAWMTQHRADGEGAPSAATSAAKETGVRSKSNLPAWMTRGRAGEGKKRPEPVLKLHETCSGTVQRVLDFGVVVEMHVPGRAPDKKVWQSRARPVCDPASACTSN